MVNASLKNAMSRRNHKERAQPLHRQRLGLLEKHKDYVHRAKDYKSKQDRIRKLREKAAFRNKDEFYWGMVKGKTKGGVAIGDRGNEALSADVVKLLKTQDVGYLRIQIAKDEKAISKLRQELEVTAPAAVPGAEWSAASELAEVEKLAEMGVVLKPVEPTAKGKGKATATMTPAGHIVFAEDEAEFKNLQSTSTSSAAVNASESQEQQEFDLGWSEPASSKKKATPKSVKPAKTLEEDDIEEARDNRMTLLKSLSAHLARLRLLRQAEAKLQATKGLMGKGAATKVREAGFVEDASQPEDRNGDRKRFEGKVWKWKLERRR